MITHVIVKLDLPIEEKYWEDDDVFSNEYYGIGKPLILCKDCKFSKSYYHGSESNLGMFTYLCTQGLYGMNADDYCSRAERKEE